MWFSPPKYRNRWRAGICNGCGVATLSIDYYDLGYQAGTMAYDILANGTDITTKEVEYAPNVNQAVQCFCLRTAGHHCSR